MAQIKIQGNPINTVGELPKVGEIAPDFKLIKSDLSEGKLSDYKGKYVILNIFPSMETGVCAASVRKFNEEITKKDNTVVLAISADLPFAAGRFCSAEGIENVIAMSTYRNPEFGKQYGIELQDGPLQGLLGRSVIIVNPEGKIIYEELVPEITQEPDYVSAINSIV